MSKQPEALRLADELEYDWNVQDASSAMWQAAAELRRLHEELQEQCRINGMGAEREARLMAVNQELVKALKSCDEAMNYMSEYDIPLTLPEQVKAAIRKATGEQL